MSLTCYLAGAMGGLSYEDMNTWRKEAANKFSLNGIKTISPVDFYNFEMDASTFDDKECMLFDLTAIKNSDIILVRLNHNSVGTAIELYEAFKQGKPVIGFDAGKELHPWMKECCFKICTDLDSAIQYINDYYSCILN